MRTRIIRKAEKIISIKPNSKAMEFYVTKENNKAVRRRTFSDLFKDMTA